MAFGIAARKNAPYSAAITRISVSRC
jgi:hypothetical protein